MKRIVLLLTFMILISCGVIDRLVMTEKYAVTNFKNTDIRGNSETNEFLFYKDLPFSGSHNIFLTFNKSIYDNGHIERYIYFEFIGKEWKFYENIFFKFDEKLINLKDPKPERIVGQGHVREILHLYPDSNFFNELYNVKQLTLQLGNDNPVIIEDIGLQKLKEFLK